MGAEKDPTQAVLNAVRHEARRQILRAIKDQPTAEPLSPRRLAERFEMPLSKVIYHTHVLVNCDAIRLVETQPARGSIEHFYEVTDLADHPVVRASLAFEADDE